MLEEIERLAGGEISDDLFQTAKILRHRYLVSSEKNPSYHADSVRSRWRRNDLYDKFNEDEFTLGLTKSQVAEAVARYWTHDRAAFLYYYPE